MPLLKKNDRRRKWRSIKKNASLICGAGITALLITSAWYVIWTSGIHFADEADMASIITTLGVTYGIIATWVLDTIWDKYKKSLAPDPASG